MALAIGNINVVTKVTWSSVSNSRVEIKEASSPPPSDDGSFLLMFN